MVSNTCLIPEKLKLSFFSTPRLSFSLYSRGEKGNSDATSISCILLWVLLFTVIAQLLGCVRLCDPMNCSTPGFPIPHYLQEFAQIHVHWVSDAIQSSPLLFLFFLTSIFPNIWIFANESTLCIRWPKYWSFSISPSNEYSGLISFSIDWFDLLGCPRDSQESSPAPQFKSINSSVLCLLYSSALTSIHDYWQNHCFDYTDLCWQSDVSTF